MHGLGGSIHGYYGYVTTGLGFGVTLNCGHVLLVVRSEGGVTLETVDVWPQVQCLQRGVTLDTENVTPGPGSRAFTLDIVAM